MAKLGRFGLRIAQACADHGGESVDPTPIPSTVGPAPPSTYLDPYSAERVPVAGRGRKAKADTPGQSRLF